MELITALLLLLVSARVFGEFSERLGQPAMVGEILAGVALGPTLLGWVRMTRELGAISDLGVLLLVLLAGMELDPARIGEAFRGRRSLVALAGFVVPLFLGFGVGALFRLDVLRTVFLGVCISITALPVAVRMLMDIGELQSEVGRQIISAAVANDVLALLILGIVLDTAGQPGWLAFARALSLSGAKVLGLLAVFAAAYRGVLWITAWAARSQKLVREAFGTLKGKETLFAGTLLFVLAFAALSENAGLHFVVGAFFGAMLLSPDLLGAENFENVQKTASGITMGLLAPVFFSGLGLQFNISAVSDYWLVAAIIAAAFVGKIAGGYWGGRLAGFSKVESRVIGFGLNGRGIMELVIANIAFKNGFIGTGMFSALVLMGALTTVVTPALLKSALGPIRGPASLVSSKAPIPAAAKN